MELTQAQYERIAPHLPVQRGNVSLSTRQVFSAILYVAEHGCKWRGLPARFGNWHTIYARMNHWAKNGELDRVFELLQREQNARIKLEAVSMNSTIVKVHLDGTGRQKKRPPIHRPLARRLDHEDSHCCREWSNRHHVLALAGTGPRRSGRT